MSPEAKRLFDSAAANGTAPLTKRKAVAELISLGLAEKKSKALHLTEAGKFAANRSQE